MAKYLFAALVVIIAVGAYFFSLTSEKEKNLMSVPLTDEQQLKDLYNEMWQALLTKDIVTLEKMHADNFVLVHMTGMNQPKSEYLECVRDGRLSYFSAKVENISVEVTIYFSKIILTAMFMR